MNSRFWNKHEQQQVTRQRTKFLRNVRSRHGRQLCIEEANRVYVGLRLGLRKRRNCGVDCCCHRKVQNGVDPLAIAEQRIGHADFHDLPLSVSLRSLCRQDYKNRRGHVTSPASALGLIPLSCDYCPPKERTAPVAIQRWLAPGRSGPIRIRKSGFLQVPGMLSNVPEKSAFPCAFSFTGVVVKMV